MTDEFNECNSIVRQMQPYKWSKSSLISEMIDQPWNSYYFTLCQQAVFFTGGLLGPVFYRWIALHSQYIRSVDHETSLRRVKHSCTHTSTSPASKSRLRRCAVEACPPHVLTGTEWAMFSSSSFNYSLCAPLTVGEMRHAQCEMVCYWWGRTGYPVQSVREPTSAIRRYLWLFVHSCFFFSFYFLTRHKKSHSKCCCQKAVPNLNWIRNQF